MLTGLRAWRLPVRYIFRYPDPVPYEEMKNAATGIGEAVIVGLHHAVVLAHRGHTSIAQGFDARKPIPYTSRNRVSRAADGDVAYPATTAAKARHATDCYLYKESGVDDNQDDSYAARRAALEEQFRALPPAGSGAYWQRIEEPDPAKQLPIEVLARCLRERNSAKAYQDADRIMTLIWRQVQPSVRRWSSHVAYTTSSGMEPYLQEELEQECFAKLWEELADDDDIPFLLVYFGVAFLRLRQHVAQEFMEKEGIRQRPGVNKSTRVPRKEIASLETSPTDEPLMTLGNQLVDPQAQNEIDQVDLSDLLDAVRRLPDDQRTVILDRFWRGLSQEETAAKLGISTRMVRYLLTKALRELGISYGGDEEGNGV